MGDTIAFSTGPRRRDDRLASREEVADYLGVPARTLAQWAYQSKGPAYRIVGRHARYRWCDVDNWVEAQAAGGDAA